MSNSYWRCLPVLLSLALVCGCSYYQPTKNVWKSTKGLWYEYVSPPASVDYEDKGDLSKEALVLSRSMMGVDTQLSRLERVMQNADKPPTQEWLDHFMQTFPWMSGFAGVKYDGSILGQFPPDSMKELDFNPLLYEDKKQNSRALRCDVQPSSLGPEIMLATPLYDGVDFLGVVVAYFDMRSLMRYAENAEDVVVLCPTALLWPGKYDFGATPLAGVDWSKVVVESSAGTCSNSTGTFYYRVRYLGNLPLVFAVPQKGNFSDGDGSLEQGAKFFPQEREKMAPPPLPERKPRRESEAESFGRTEEGAGEPVEEQQEEAAEQPRQEPVQTEQPARRSGTSNEIEPGSRESILLRKGGAGRGRHIEERSLEGENIEVERVQSPRRPARRQEPADTGPTLRLLPDSGTSLPARPSPFGPREEVKRPSPFGPAEEASTPATEQAPPQSAGQPAEQQSQIQSDSGERLADGEKAPPPATTSETAPKPEEKGATPAVPAGADGSDSGDRLADGEKAPAQQEGSSTESGEAPNETRNDAEPRKPSMLPGGRPSPFGPR